MPNNRSVYFDSCLFIELLQQDHKDRFEACDDLRIQAARMDLLIATSALTIAEVFKVRGVGSFSDDKSKKILAFFENQYIVIRPVDRYTAEMAHDIARKHSLTCNDAIHVATALIAKVPVLYTYDGVGGRRKGLLRHHLKIGKPALRIEQPPKPSAGPIFPPS
jgi:predicted nucleic acid-binding protein